MLLSCRHVLQAPDGDVSVVTDAPPEGGATQALDNTGGSDSQPNGLRVAKGVDAVQSALRWCAAQHGLCHESAAPFRIPVYLQLAQPRRNSRPPCRKQQQLIWEDVQRAMEAEAQSTSAAASTSMPASLAAVLVREVKMREYPLYISVASAPLCASTD